MKKLFLFILFLTALLPTMVFAQQGAYASIDRAESARIAGGWYFEYDQPSSADDIVSGPYGAAACTKASAAAFRDKVNAGVIDEVCYQFPGWQYTKLVGAGTPSPIYATFATCDTARNADMGGGGGGGGATPCEPSTTLMANPPPIPGVQSWVYVYKASAAGIPMVSPPRGTESSCTTAQDKNADAPGNEIVSTCYNIGGSTPGSDGVQTGATGEGEDIVPLSVSDGSEITYTLLAPIPGFLPTTAPRSFDDILDILAGYFRLTIAIAGLLAVIRIIWCGFNLIMSVSPSAREEAKKCVKMAVLGLLLALGSFALMNSIREDAGGGPFTLPNIPGSGGAGAGGGGAGGGEGGVPVLPGSPVCTLSSPNTSIYENSEAYISITCTDDPTSFIWTSSDGAPPIPDVGGLVSFPIAGDYTYRVRGVNNVGPGRESGYLTIRVRTLSGDNATACLEDMPQDIPNTSFVCRQGSVTQTNTTLNWSDLGEGWRTSLQNIKSVDSLSVLFRTNGPGSYGSASTSELVGSRNPDNIVYANISEAACDFRYENIDRGVCATYGAEIEISFQVGGGDTPENYGGTPGCILKPNTAYYINIRNEDPTVAGLNTCPLTETCEFNFSIQQSADGQFSPVPVVACTVAADPDPIVPPPPPPPSLTLPNLVNNAVVPPGRIEVAFTAAVDPNPDAPDDPGITSIEFTVHNLETGKTVSQRSGCSTTEITAACVASTSFLTYPPINTLTLKNSDTGAIIPSDFSCRGVTLKNSPTTYVCSWDFQITDPAVMDAVRVENTYPTPSIIDPELMCDDEILIPRCAGSVSNTALLTVGPGEGSYRITATACGVGGCTTQSRTVTIQNPCERGDPGLVCVDLPNTTLASQNFCATAPNIVNNISSTTVYAHRFRLTPGESARLLVANRPMLACPIVPVPMFGPLYKRLLKDGQSGYAMTDVDVWTEPGTIAPSTFVGTVPAETFGIAVEDTDGTDAEGYRWRNIEFEQGDRPSGWVKEHLLHKASLRTPRGSYAPGDIPDPLPAMNTWCNTCGLASSTLLGICDYVRNPSLNILIGKVPGETTGFLVPVAGDSSTVGTCSTSMAGGTGHFEITIKTSGAAEEGVCVVSPNKDYYVNVETDIRKMDIKPKQETEDYAVLFGKIPATPPPSGPMCFPYDPPYLF